VCNSDISKLSSANTTNMNKQTTSTSL
jgi:hypothetical protein